MEELMNEKAEFLKKLNELVEIAKKQGNQIKIEEVQTYFSKENLTEEQVELVFDYLMEQKVSVIGYVKLEEEQEEVLVLTDEEQRYLDEYVMDLKAFQSIEKEEVQSLIESVLQGDEQAKTKLIEVYLKEVVEIAKKVHRPEVFLGDLIQEGNLGLIMSVEMLTDVSSAHDVILTQIKQSMQLLLEECEELSNRDKKMVEKVQLLDEAITNLTEELGRKVTIDELAIYMGMEIEEIEDTLKLAGEEPEKQ